MNKIIISAAIFASFPIHSFADDIYKWIGKDGVVHYGNVLPAKYAGVSVDTIDKHGLFVRQTKAALTEKQLLDQKQQNDQLEKKKRDELEQKRHDISLLNTYTSESDVDAAKQDNLKQIQAVINGLNTQMSAISENKSPSNEDKKRISDMQHQIDEQKREYADTEKRFDDDKARFELLNKEKDKQSVQQ